MQISFRGTKSLSDTHHLEFVRETVLPIIRETWPHLNKFRNTIIDQGTLMSVAGSIIEDEVRSMLTCSYHGLEKDLQDIFVDVAMFSNSGKQSVDRWFWSRTSMLYENYTAEKLLSKCIRLQSLGYWELDWNEIGSIVHYIHLVGYIDGKHESQALARYLAMSSGRYLIYSGSYLGVVEPKDAQNMAGISRILVLNKPFDAEGEQFKNLFKQCSRIDNNVVLLVIKFDASKVFDAEDSLSIMPWSKLRVLELTGLVDIQTISGLESTPDLLCLVLKECPDLRELYAISRLQSLKELEIAGAKLLELPDLKNLKHLQRLSLTGCSKLCRLTELQCTSAVLEDLEFIDCSNLEDLSGIGGFQSLQRIFISGFSKLQEFPIVKLDRLRTLVLRDCMCGARQLHEEVPNLEELDLSCMQPQKLDSSEKKTKISFPSLQKMRRLRIVNLGCLDCQYYDSFARDLDAAAPDLVSLEHNVTIQLAGKSRGTRKDCELLFNNFRLKSFYSWSSVDALELERANPILHIPFITDGEDNIITYLISEMLPHDKVEFTFMNEKSLGVPKSIHNIIRNAKMCIIVITKNFVKKKWAMAQLQYLFHQRNASIYSERCPLIGIFFGIEPGDLVNANKIKNWKEMSESMDPSNQLLFNIINWEETLEMLDSSCELHIEVPKDLLSPLKYDDLQRWTKENIVMEHILTKLEPINNHRIQLNNEHTYIVEEIAEKFTMIANRTKTLKEKEISPLIVGFYDTHKFEEIRISEIMEQYYHNESLLYRSFCLILPNEEDEDFITTQVKKNLKELELANDDVIAQIMDVNQAILVFSQRMELYQGYIIIDNVCDWSKYHVLCMFNGELGGCRIIFTSPLERILKWLFCHMNKEFVYVDSISTIKWMEPP